MVSGGSRPSYILYFNHKNTKDFSYHGIEIIFFLNQLVRIELNEIATAFILTRSLLLMVYLSKEACLVENLFSSS